jgi:hypothetical protein
VTKEKVKVEEVSQKFFHSLQQLLLPTRVRLGKKKPTVFWTSEDTGVGGGGGARGHFSKVKRRSMLTTMLRFNRVARWFAFRPKIPVWVNFGCAYQWKILVCFMTI